jgi:hypothetical protein
MKTRIIKSMAMIAMAIVTSTTVSFGQKEENHHVGEAGMGPHKGTIQEADPYHAEILVKDGKVMFYLLDGEAKPMKNAGITGTVTLLMANGKSVVEKFTASGDDGFTISNTNAATFKSCIASFTVKGKTVSAKFKAENAKTASAAGAKIYTCSMHPEVKSDKPGKCSKCGMDLIEKK